VQKRIHAKSKTCWVRSVGARRAFAFYPHADSRTTTVPQHKGRDLAVPLVHAILADIRMSPDDCMRLLQS
jgi:predicted RNA binding protein YcfA (HicA-like mRNA interferase family)